MIPTALRSRISTFFAGVRAAQPVENATPITKAALVTAGVATLGALDAALAGAAGALDADDPVGFPGDFGSDLAALAASATDQMRLSDLRGLVGREVFNLEQA